MKKTVTIILAMILSIGLSAQGNTPAPTEQDSQVGQALLETEKILDNKILEISNRMQLHTKLFKMKVEILPFRTVLYKGKAQNDDCVIGTTQEDQANNCIKVEVFDFIDSDDGKREKTLGTRNKYMILFFDGQNSTQDDYKVEPKRTVNKIRSRILVNNFAIEDKKIAEVTDLGPNTVANHNDKLFVFYQHDNHPEYGATEKGTARGEGKYALDRMENTKTNPMRNEFKKNYYVKHLDFFDKLFTKIYDYNDKDSNWRYKAANKALKESLKY